MSTRPAAALLPLAFALPIPVRSQRAAPKRPPNIVFFMADDLGYGHLGCYGQKRIETPNIDRLAREGMRFTDAYAGCTVCAPSRSVLMTGLHAGHTSVRGNLGSISLLDEDSTIAEVLAGAGYRSGCFGKWGLGTEGTPGHPNKQGFDDFCGYLHQVHAHFYYPYWLSDNGGKRLPLPENENGKRGRYAHDVIIERALRFIRKSKDEPFFCYIPVTIPHVELAVPEESLRQYRGRWEETPGHQEKRAGYIVADEPKATFAAMVSHMDRDVGRVLALLEELSIDGRTIFFFTSDNGAQHGYDVQEEFFAASGPLRGYKGSMYEGGLRVPLIVRWPGKIEPGSETGHVCYFADILPTLAEVAGIGEVEKTDGISFVPTLLGATLAGRPQREHELLYWELYRRNGKINQAARMGDWKLVQPKPGAPFELYRLPEDPGEMRNVAAECPDILQTFRTCLRHARTPPRKYEMPRKRVSARDYVR